MYFFTSNEFLLFLTLNLKYLNGENKMRERIFMNFLINKIIY